MRPYGYDFIILCPIKARAQVTKIPINVNMVYSLVFLLGYHRHNTSHH